MLQKLSKEITEEDTNLAFRMMDDDNSGTL